MLFEVSQAEEHLYVRSFEFCVRAELYWQSLARAYLYFGVLYQVSNLVKSDRWLVAGKLSFEFQNELGGKFNFRQMRYDIEQIFCGLLVR